MMEEAARRGAAHDWPWAFALAGIVLGLGWTMVGRWWL